MSTSTNGPSPETCTAYIELSIALALGLWPALSLAVSNNWGGPSSSDKRDWFAGAIASLFEDDPETDMEDVETVLLQVMLDEFEVNVDDGTAFEVAERIVELREKCLKGDFADTEALKARWELVKSRGQGERVRVVEQDGSTDGDSVDGESDSESEDGDGDVEMGEAVEPREKVAPEVDEDGFTKVMGKKKR